MSAAAFQRAQRCFALASHPSTREGERAAAMDRGLALIEKYGFDADLFDIPGREYRPKFLRDHVEMLREQREFEIAEAMKPTLGKVFGTCLGCGAVASGGGLCLACSWKAESLACEHGQHGFCLDCEGIAA